MCGQIIDRQNVKANVGVYKCFTCKLKAREGRRLKYKIQKAHQ